MEKVVLFYNPKSGNETFKNQVDYVVERFNKAGKILIPFRLTSEDILDQYMELIKWNGVEKIIIAGGDGTIHMILNKMLNQHIHKKVALFPVGTANDFAQYFKMPHDLDELIDIALNDHYKVCDVGQINDQYFINIASFGNLVNISQKVNNQSKTNIGVLAYYIKGIEELPKLKPIHATFKMADKTFEEDIFFALVMNGKSAGGFKKLAPYSDISDGKLDILVFKKCPILEIMPLLIKVLSGEHPKSQYIEYFQTDSITIECEDGGISDLDGEPGPEFPLNISVLSEFVEINVPEN